MKISPMSEPRKGQRVQCVECSKMIECDHEIVYKDLEGVPFKAYYHEACIPAFREWMYLEESNGYWFWKYEDKNAKAVYNVTQAPKPPTTDGGYYSYGYLLKVKGLKGDTLDSIMKELKP